MNTNLEIRLIGDAGTGKSTIAALLSMELLKFFNPTNINIVDEDQDLHVKKEHLTEHLNILKNKNINITVKMITTRNVT